MITEKMTSGFLRALQHVQSGSLQVTLPNGQQYQFTGSQPGPQAVLQIHDNRVIRNLIWQGDIGFAEDYRQNHWDSPDIANLIEFSLRNAQVLQNYVYGNRWRQYLATLRYVFQRNSRRGSRKNIQAHYDLSNAFYALWLDPGMTYSSALYQQADDNLEDAQNHKYDRILQQLGNNRQRMLEIGCGWGGFAARAQQAGTDRFTGITVSPAQYEYARQRLRHSTDAIQLTDYRDLQGSYDSIVSIEMFEAVGKRYWRTYFDKIKHLLSQQGRAVIQTITISDDHFAEYQRSGDAIRSYIFPGGMLPSLSRFRQEAEQAGLRLTDNYSFGQDYARTLRCWQQRFDAQTTAIRALSFDTAFIRLWRYYLGCCAGAFAAGRTNVMQVTLTHA